jgi:LPS O-antigen subunit length determinant protein (WzzB/FepE family)
VTKIKLDSAMANAAQDALTPHVDYARQAINNGKLTASELRHELTAVTEGLRATVFPDVLVKG